MINEYNTNQHVMIDIETMGNSTESPILSIGIVQFNPFTGERSYDAEINISLESSLAAGTKPNADTILWWLSQSEEARDSLKKSQIEAYSLTEGLMELSKTLRFCALRAGVKMEDLRVWGNGATFDLSIISHSYSLVKLKEPWMHYNERDVRTIVAFLPEVKSSMPFDGIRHSVISDCNHQIAYVSEILKNISVK